MKVKKKRGWGRESERGRQGERGRLGAERWMRQRKEARAGGSEERKRGVGCLSQEQMRNVTEGER